MLILLIIKISRFARNDKKGDCDTVSQAGIQNLLITPGRASLARNDEKTNYDTTSG
jgi:hypothetical protein